ncbi:Protoporphyrinogen IX oxidase, aerobic, HemY [hydrothermal vent metagenome]|uniref:Protoporphyrinogen IX oxidase, aerobic, HemY n=1 Tax=hydrothermal vent metagenome TaxID=652676 RepID=A0A3B1CKL4_9ZZZZ
MKKIVIIGGGIAGLAAAHRLQEEITKGASLQCVVVEAMDQFGGKIATERFDGFVIERGPDSFISQKPAAIALCKKLGLGDRLVGTNQEQTKTYVYTGKKLVTMPDGLSLMIPTQFLPFAFTPLFSWPGKVRMALDLIIPKKIGNADESLASFVRRRMGEEALQKMAEPMLAGIYASDPETMSINSTFPMFVQTEKKYRSLILGMLARKRQQLMQKPSPPKPGNNHQPFSLFMTLKNGLGEMVDAVIEKSPDINFRTGARVRAVTKATASAWQVVLEDGETIDADAVLFATPAKLSADFLKPVAPKVADLLNRIKYVSTATVTLAYKKEGFTHSLNGFGFVVPRTEGRKILACTWTSSKFPHRTPEGYVMLRCFVGGALKESLAEQDEGAIATMVKKELADLMDIHQEPEICKVFHNRKSNVQYRVGHADLIESVQKELQAVPGLFLTGSAYTGIGIPDCIQNGTRAAESMTEFLSATTKTES